MKFQVVETPQERRQERRRVTLERALRYKQLYETMTLEEIGALEGITRERVRQIMSLVGVTKKDGWRYKLSLSKCAEAERKRVHRREERCQEIYLCSWHEYCAVTGHLRYVGKPLNPKPTSLVNCYHQHRDNALRLGIPWKVSLPDFAAIVGDAWKEIGRSKLHFARKDKTQPFTRDNCELLAHAVNSTVTRQQAKEREMARTLDIVDRMASAGLPLEDIARTVGRSKSSVRQQLYRIRNKETFGERD